MVRVCYSGLLGTGGPWARCLGNRREETKAIPARGGMNAARNWPVGVIPQGLGHFDPHLQPLWVLRWPVRDRHGRLFCSATIQAAFL